MKVLILSILLLLAVYEARKTERIVGGSVTNTLKYPYQVGIVQLVGSKYNVFLGGSIIAPNYVLTSCSSFRSFNNGTNVDYSLTNVFVVSTNKISEINVNKRYAVQEVNFHPSWTASNNASNRVDICVLRVSTIAFDSSTKPVVLARSQDTSLFPVGVTSYVSGFGTTNGNNVVNKQASNELNQVSIPTVSAATCNTALNNNGLSFNYSYICAGSTGKDACSGDGGSALTVVTSSNVYLQIGVVAFATVNSAAPVQCGAAGNYGVYIDVSAYRSSFIEPITGPLYNLGDSGVATNNATTSSSSTVIYSVAFLVVLTFSSLLF